MEEIGSRNVTEHRHDSVPLLLRLGLAVQAIDGALEMGGGLLLLVTKPEALARWVRLLTQHELPENPAEFLPSLARLFARYLGGDLRSVAVVYLLAHGLAKLALAVSTLRGSLRAYPPMIAFLVFFASYAAQRGVRAGSVFLILAAIFNALVAALLWRKLHVAQREGRLI